jgi:hypothetical protein
MTAHLQAIGQNELNTQTVDSRWKSLYKIGGAAALMAVMAFLLDIAISIGGEDFNPATLTAVEWFSLFQENGLAGLRALGFINIISLTVSVSLYFALYGAHRREKQVAAGLALILYLLGAAIYISNNAAIPMAVLSEKYASAATESQRTLIAAAGEAVLVRGADFTPGSFIGFFFTEMAGLAFSFVMLRSWMFSKITAILGILGFVLLSIFTILTTFVPLFFDVAMILAMAGGLLSAAWYILVARGLFQLGNGPANPKTQQQSLVAAG